MSQIEIRHDSGESERRKLSKSQPLSIGTHVSNDVVVEGPGIALLHCRISWNKSVYEIVAAGPAGVELNGTLVQHAVLEPGDVARVGDLDIEFLGDREPVGSRAGRVVATSQSSHEIGVDPITGELPAGDADKVSESRRSSKRAETPKRSTRKTVDVDPRSSGQRKGKSRNDDDISDELEVLEPDIDENFFEDQSEKKSKSKDKSSSKSRGSKQRDIEIEAPPPPRNLKDARKKVRPGDQDALRSPVVHILIYGAGALLLLAGVFWFWIGRDKADELFAKAMKEMSAGQYVAAVDDFTLFIDEFPKDLRAADAAVNRGRCRVLSYIKAAAPSWSKGLKALQEFIEENRNKSNFSDLYPDLVEYGSIIGEGAANSALTSKATVTERRELVEIAKAGETIVERYASRDKPPVELMAKINTGIQAAETSILKQSTFEKAVAEVEQSIQGSDPMGALDKRRSLLDQYAEFENDPKVVKLLEQILQTEKSRVGAEDLVREGLRDEQSPAPFGGLTLALHSQVRADNVSEGRVVVAVAKDCCYGVDSITGDPVWRRVIGLDTPFFPVSVTASVPSMLLFDTNFLQLVLVERETGKLVWRQPLGELVSGPPLVESGQLFVATLGNHLYRIDLGSGRIAARLNLSQKLLSPPVLITGKDQLVVAGDREVFYTFTIRPFECAAVSYVGHSPGSIKAPLLTMGALVLAAVNDRAETSQLRVFDTRNEDGRLTEMVPARANVDGVVRDQPTLRGNQLFVTSSGQRISSFTVTDAANQPPLTAGPRFQVQTPHEGPIYLMAGPEGQLWMSSDTLRRLQVGPNAISEDPHTVAAGFASQPLQLVGKNLYVGRRAPYSNAIFFSQADREEMTSQWRIVLGASVLAWVSPDAASANCVTDDGSVFSITPADIAANGFKIIATSHMELPESPASPLRAVAVPSGRIVVASSGAKPQIWVVGERGQLERPLSLPKPLEAKPVEIAQGIVLPLPGRLKLLSVGQSKKTEDFIAPVTEGKTSRWTQLLPLDGTQFIGLTDGGLLGRYQFRPEPVPHLDIAQSVQLAKPVDLPIDVQGGRLFVADSAGQLLVLDAQSLDTVASTPLESAANSSPFLVDGRIYVSTSRSGLVCYQLGNELKKAWGVPLENASLAGAPLLVNGKLIAALSSGNVLALDVADGSVRGKLGVGQPLTDGPKRIGNKLIVPSIDGTLHPIESILQAPKP